MDPSAKRNSPAEYRDLTVAPNEVAKFGAQPKVTMKPVGQPHSGVTGVRSRKESGCGGVAASDEKIHLSINRRIRNVIVPVDGKGGEAIVACNQADLAAQPNSLPKDFFSTNRRVAEEFTIQRSGPGQGIPVRRLSEHRYREQCYATREKAQPAFRGVQTFRGTIWRCAADQKADPQPMGHLLM